MTKRKINDVDEELERLGKLKKKEPPKKKAKAAPPPKKEEIKEVDPFIINDIDEAFAYMLSGKITVKLRSKRTDTEFTYRIDKASSGSVWFVSMKVEDQQYPFQYFGFLKKDKNSEEGIVIFIHGRDKAKQLTWGHDGVKGFDWAWKIIAEGELHKDLEIEKVEGGK